MSGVNWNAAATTMLVAGLLCATMVGLKARRAAVAFGPVRDLPARARRLLRVVVAAIALLCGIGFAVGFALPGGPLGRRVTFGLVGVGLAWALVWFLVVVVGFTGAIWKAAHLTRDAVPIPPPDDVGHR